MVAATGKQNVQVILAPCDLRGGAAAPKVPGPAWASDLYETIREQMGAYRPAGSAAAR